MKRLDSLICWVVLMVIYLVIAYIYNRRYIRRQENKPRHTRKEKEEAKQQKKIKPNFFKCVSYWYSKEAIGKVLYVSNLVYEILCTLQIVLLILYVSGLIMYNDIILVAVNCICVFLWFGNIGFNISKIPKW